ncbi:MAG: 3-isopropylmalate dehydrogenase [Ignavibacteriales bacterium]|nr:3-isopropylmalate dehydrogenase [Ignavibacteriales bacterium]
MKAHIAVLPGDGIGPEVLEQAVRVLQIVGTLCGHEFTFSEHPIGGCSIDAHGIALTDETLAACRKSDAVLLGAVGGPQWDNPDAAVRPEQGLLALRKGLNVYANLRPVKPHPALFDASPLKPQLLDNVDIMVIRELTGGLYFGQPKFRKVVDGQRQAVDTLVYTETEVRRIVELAFHLAQQRRKKVTSVDKANVLESSRLWRQVASEVAAHYPDVTLDHMLVDTASMRLVTLPAQFDVLVTENMFGDILTDEASILAGSMGMLPSASLGDGGPGLYEPIHGSAPDIAGKGIANPIGSIASAAMLLRYSLKLEREAAVIDGAVDSAITRGCRTKDLGGSLSTRRMTDEIIESFQSYT